MAGAQTWALISVEATSPIVSAARAAAAEGDADAVLEALVAEGLRVVPDFAIAQTSSDGARLIVRGEAVARAEGGPGSAVVTGSEGSLWSDRHVVARRILLSAPRAGTGIQELRPLMHSPVLASQLELTWISRLGSAGRRIDSPAENGSVEPEGAQSAAIVGAGTSTSGPHESPRPEFLSPIPPSSLPATPPASSISTISLELGFTVLPAVALDLPVQQRPTLGVEESVAAEHGAEPRPAPPSPPGARPEATRPAGSAADNAVDEAAATATTSRPAMPRPAIARLVSHRGEIFTLERSLVLGRSPSIPPGYEAESPALVTIPDESRGISGLHAYVRVQDGSITLIDLGSTNGTFVADGSGGSAQLKAGVPVVLGPGAIFSLADVVRVQVQAM
ncbi:MAG: FHA domain-containing protein [Actinomycetales bacterium]|nr:FHA domain-containing protein [Actinomycetales bacterium]